MTPRLPDADGPANDESTDAQPPTRDEPPPPPSTARRIAVVGGLVVAAVVIAVLLMDSADPERAPEGETGPEQGVACPFLRDAFDEFEGGNDAAFQEAVRVAAREAELTLERSGEVFGRPEELALELRSQVERGAGLGDRRLSSVLAQAESSCAELTTSKP